MSERPAATARRPRDDSPLSSHALGTASNDLVTLCDAPRPARRELPSVTGGPPVAVALSGGGFRATFAALGVVRFLAGAGLLGRMRWLSSVSGGSVAAGMVACRHEDLEAGDFSVEAFDDAVVDPMVAQVTSNSLKGALIRNVWRAIGPRTRTDVLALLFDRWFFGARRLDELSDGCRFVFNAANLATGVRFGFERDALGDWVLGEVPTAGTRLRVAEAVAASAAVPGAFAPFSVRGVDFPCARGRTAKLVDGGAYDNSGMEVIDDLRGALIVAVNAGGLFRTGAYGGVPLVRDLQRATSLLYRQSTGLRRREMVDRFRAYEARRDDPPEWGRRGVLFGLATVLEAPAEWSNGRPERREWVDRLAQYATSFDRFPTDVCRELLYRGWWLAGATLTRYHRDVLPAELPNWSDPRSLAGRGGM
jgi:NTE family protein